MADGPPTGRHPARLYIPITVSTATLSFIARASFVPRNHPGKAGSSRRAAVGMHHCGSMQRALWLRSMLTQFGECTTELGLKTGCLADEHQPRFAILRCCRLGGWDVRVGGHPVDLNVALDALR